VFELNRFRIIAPGAFEAALIVARFIDGLDGKQEHGFCTHRASTRAERDGRIVVVRKLHGALLTCTGKSATGLSVTDALAEPLSMMTEP
jgi:hypothetical protein